MPDLWLDGARLDPAAPLVRSGITDGSLIGLGGRAPGARLRERPGLAEILVVAGPDAGLVVPVGAGEHVIARDAGQVRLTDTDVSRRAHCVITVERTAGGLDCTVRDAGSTNGTAVDGVPAASSRCRSARDRSSKISSMPAPTKPSPEAGMNIMRKAVAKNDLAKLKTRRKRIKNNRSK